MFSLLWLVPIIPFAGFAVLALLGRRLPRRAVSFIGVGAVGLSALLALAISVHYLLAPPPGVEHAFSQTLWQWLHVGNFSAGITFYLDPLSVVMMLVVSVIGFFIHLYSVGYMAGDGGYARFFACMNLFVGSMLTLVLADNLLLLYLGWEGVGMCSYLLIGFWYTDPANVRAAMKAFIITRIGDCALAVALFLLYNQLGTLQIHQLLLSASQHWPRGSAMAIVAAALLLGGALGKSAQLPLQTWLPDAMAGPTPVSALIHAATMVTAGVYLIARTNVLFTLAPSVQGLVALIGVLTLLLAALSALVQRDVKRILAYSTMSQVGYMFLALGVGAWSASIFHLLTHACFKALLFLAAGVVILSVHEEHDIYRMGGLARKMPFTFAAYLIGALSLASFPFVTAGFYSKDAILYQTYASTIGGPWLWAGAWIGAFLTAVYSFRMIFLVFFGKEKTVPNVRKDLVMAIPLAVLALLSLSTGFLELPRVLGNLPTFSRFLQPVLPGVTLAQNGLGTEWLTLILSMLASLGGILLAYLCYGRRPVAAPASVAPLTRWLAAGFGFDYIYHQLFVRPFLWFAHADKNDVIDSFFMALARLCLRSSELLSGLQTGKVRRYAMALAIGVLLVIALLVFV